MAQRELSQTGLPVCMNHLFLKTMEPEMDLSNVKRFGATGDGSTDDTVAIKAAITYAEANGRYVIYIPTGTYIISETISIPSYFEVFGDGPKSILKLSDVGEGSLTGYTVNAIIANSEPLYPLLITDQDATTEGQYLHDVTIDGNTDAIQATDHLIGFAGLWINDNTGCRVERVNIDDCNKDISRISPGNHRNFCLVLTNATYVSIIGGEYGDAGYESIGVRGETKFCTIDGMVVEKDESTEYGRHGIQFAGDPCTHHTLSNSRLTGKHCKIISHGGQYLDISQCIVREDDSLSVCMVLMDNAKHITIDGCRWLSHASDPLVLGIAFRGDATDYPEFVTVTGCSSDVKGYSVDLGAGKHITFAGNNFTSTGRRVIEISQEDSASAPTDVVIVGNHLEESGAIDSNDGTIHALDTARLVIRDNTIIACTDTNAIELDGVTDGAVEHNRITVSGTGVAIDESNSPDYTARGNIGFVDSNRGTATVANTATSVTVTHGLDFTPTANDITVTPTSLGNATGYYVDTIGATTFAINTDSDPGAGTATFSWKAEKGE